MNTREETMEAHNSFICISTGRIIELTLATCFMMSPARAQVCETWSSRWGAAGNDYTASLALDNAGAIYSAGLTTGAGTSGDALLLKLDPGGALSWSSTWAGPQSDALEGAAYDLVAGGGVLMAGVTTLPAASNSDVLLLEFDLSGGVKWVRSWGTDFDDQASSICLDAAGNRYVCGGTKAPSSGAVDHVLVMKYASGGLFPQNPQAITWGGGSEASVNACGIDASSGTEFLYVVGNHFTPGNGYDALIQKYDTSLNLIWSRVWGESADDDYWGMTLDGLGNVYATGATSSLGNNQEVLLQKWDANGQLLWGRTWGGLQDEGTGGVAVDAAGNVILTGDSNSFGAGPGNALLVMFDSSGGLQWSKTWGASTQLDVFGSPQLVGGVILAPGLTGTQVAGLTNAVGATNNTSTSTTDPGYAVTAISGAETNVSGNVSTSQTASIGGLFEAVVVEFVPCQFGTPYCFGNGGGTACPCMNTASAGQGCGNSSGLGGTLIASGSASVSADNLQFSASNLLPFQPALLFGANNAINSGNGIAFGDGLRCAGGSLIRLGVQTPSGAGEATWGPSLLTATGWTAGMTRHFQAWYRDPAISPCGSGFNLTHGVTLVLEP